MPFKSKAQRRKFAALLVEGKITPETFEEWNRETGSAQLPERVRSKKKTASVKRTTRKAASRKRAADATRATRKPADRKATTKRTAGKKRTSRKRSVAK